MWPFSSKKHNVSYINIFRPILEKWTQNPCLDTKISSDNIVYGKIIVKISNSHADKGFFYKYAFIAKRNAGTVNHTKLELIDHYVTENTSTSPDPGDPQISVELVKHGKYLGYVIHGCNTNENLVLYTKFKTRSVPLI